MNREPQARVYVAAMGVVLGMLVAGLVVPLGAGGTGLPLGVGSSSADLPAAADGSFGTGIPGATVGPDGSLPAGAEAPDATALPGGALPGSGAPGASGGPSGPGSSAGPGGASPAPGGPLNASDQGVTATTIKLGVVLLDVESLRPLGFALARFTPEEQRQQAQFFIDRINRSGGVLGRKITPVYATLNALDSSGSQSAAAVCSRLAEDEKVFAAIGYLNDVSECLPQQFGIPAFTDSGRIVESYTKSRNLLVTPRSATERTGANWGDLAARAGLLEDRTLGTVYMDAAQESRPEAALVGALDQAGYDIAYRGKLANDAASAQSQMPVTVNQMRSAGVDTVLIATNFVTALQFVQTAESQGFRPQYLVSDLGNLTSAGLLNSMPTSFDGALAFTQDTSGSKESAADRGCREAFNAGAREDSRPGDDSRSIRLFCWWTTTFAEGARAAGTDLTRAGLIAGIQRLGQPSLPVLLGGSFATAKTDFADFYRPARYDRECRCYQDAGGAQRGRY